MPITVSLLLILLDETTISSAEHGIGVCKREYLPLQKEKAVVDLMSLLKRQLDPKNILNPGKLI